jgi:hypothetical protein
MDSELYRLRIRYGIAVLDRIKPGWREQIDLSTLWMGSCVRCILGQLFGDYSTGLGRVLYATVSVDVTTTLHGAAFGFSLEYPDGEHNLEHGENWHRLTQLWKEELQKAVVA